MLRLIGVSLLYILLCNPPILFFLNRICKKQFHVWWVALFSFLLGWLLCFPVGFFITTEELEGYGWVHESDELYSSLWCDPNTKRLYVEIGNW